MNRLYYGDNLDVLRESIANESVDLIYLDPPFNSSANYNILFKSPSGQQSDAQITAFEDTWQWGSESERLLEQMKFRRGDLALFLDFFVDSLGKNALSAYLVMMAARLVELHRVLKLTGSLYLHCDPTASHYLKVILDMIFGTKNFRNEIIWHYKTFQGQTHRYFAKKHDTIFWFSKSESFVYNQQFDTSFQNTVDSKRWASYFDDKHQIIDIIGNKNLRKKKVLFFQLQLTQLLTDDRSDESYATHTLFPSHHPHNEPCDCETCPPLSCSA